MLRPGLCSAGLAEATRTARTRSPSVSTAVRDVDHLPIAVVDAGELAPHALHGGRPPCPTPSLSWSQPWPPSSWSPRWRPATEGARVANLRPPSATSIATDIRSGERIFRLSGPVVAQPSKHTIQRWESEHLSPDGALWASVNHACMPNCTIDFETWELVSCSPIRVGEEITFNYNSTEWEITSPFNCACGSPNCGQVIRGFRYLDCAQRADLRALLSPYLKSLFFTTDPPSHVASPH